MPVPSALSREIRMPSDGALPTIKESRNRAFVHLIKTYLRDASDRDAFFAEYKVVGMDWGRSKGDCAVRVVDKEGNQAWLGEKIPGVIKYHRLASPDTEILAELFRVDMECIERITRDGRLQPDRRFPAVR